MDESENPSPGERRSQFIRRLGRIGFLVAALPMIALPVVSLALVVLEEDIGWTPPEWSFVALGAMFLFGSGTGATIWVFAALLALANRR